MTDANYSQAQDAIRRAYQALRANDRAQARQYAAQAAELDPNLEDPWLILAGLAGPQAAVQYLKRALAINPDSARAHKGMAWAVQRLDEAHAQAAADVMQQSMIELPVIPAPAPVPEKEKTAPVHIPPVGKNTVVLANPSTPRRRAWLGWGGGVLAVIVLACALWLTWPMITGVFAQAPSASRPAGLLQKPTLTFTPTFTATATVTPTETFTPTATYTATATFTTTPLPSSTLTNTPLPTKTKVPATKAPTAAQPVSTGPLPSNIQADQHWVDVDLTHQRAYAYQGTQVVRSFVVSTGISIYPTVTGQYHVYVKYRYADMRGVGWYLPNVPYVMYFYKGYGLHGTYWHNNFGHPMSHGCVNFKTEDAAWLFDFSSVGTLVNIHY
jgi:lipoprotein-anchoring transpeptidase ErfK/SrfK